MQNAEMQVIRFSDENVIATSGGEKLLTGMSENAFQVKIDYATSNSVCFYHLVNAPGDAGSYNGISDNNTFKLVSSNGTISDTSYDEMGEFIPENVRVYQTIDSWNTDNSGIWFHYLYNTDEETYYFQACEDDSHHSN